MKRAYKLQEFVAHSSHVNCLKIGRKTSRVLVTGGEDHKVNMWAIGKPNAILIACSLAGHTSPVASVTFDAAESLVVAGSATGAIKLWDLEEAKIVRTLSGHRSSCSAVDFHPFGEFFASASVDSNLKIWDIRRKGCIHTYKGHSRAVNCLKFSPDGRWVVSGGEDNIVKLWDLTAGKLIHDFKFHGAKILSLEFHPHEFLLATGSDDRTAKFYDLETFELIGSSGPEDNGVRSMAFTPDGRTLLCAMQENLKVYTWEPLRCHDVIDASWSQIADLNVHEGKLLGCAFNQRCVGVWVVDLARVAPFRSSTPARELKSPSGERVTFHKVTTPSPTREGGNVAMAPRRSTVNRDKDNAVRLSSPEPSRQNASPAGENSARSTSIKLSSIRKNSAEIARKTGEKELECDGRVGSPTATNLLVTDKKDQDQADFRQANSPRSPRSPRNSSTTPKEENDTLVKPPGGRTRKSLSGLDADILLKGSLSGQALADADSPRNLTSLGASTTGYGRPWSSVHWDKEEKDTDISPRRSRSFFVELDPLGLKRSRSLFQDDIRVIDEILQERSSMTSTMQSRLAKLQVVRRFWMKNDLKSAVETMAKMGDKSVLVDGLSVLIERSDVFNLEIAAMLLPLLNGLLISNTQRHLMVAIAFTSMLVKNFGHVIYDTVSTSAPPIGVDLQAERRFERCTACFKELQLFKQTLKPFLRKSGELGKAALELTLALERMKM